MKFYVSADMEGIAGVVLREQLFRGEPLYEEARRLLTLEVNAVTQALLEGGAAQVVVKDAHGGGFNFIPELLHPAADYVLGATRTELRFPGLDESFDGAVLVGYHAMGGTQAAVRDHTMSSLGWQQIELNGSPFGEIALDALLFGERGVPVVFVSGDDKTCAEAFRTLPGVSVYETKTATGRHSALCKPPARVREEIRSAVKDAVRNRERCAPFHIPGPYELTLRFLSTDQADARRYDGINSVRADGLTAVYKGEDFTAVYASAM